ncbi:T9SS type A sorting domain-containing protein, partial [Fluviicola sp.]|uniref:T9SS type A sorting domain-containing protein n=1 Tax=Fluviicola sp. TaxID=1917219 RepID=UPI00262A0CD0
ADQTNALIESVSGVDLKVYPNPAKEKMTIHLESNQDFSLEVEVLSLLGTVESVVRPVQLSQGIHEFELNAQEMKLSKGVYYLRLQVNGLEKQWKICFN